MFASKPYDKLNKARKSIWQNSTSFYDENWGIIEIYFDTRKAIHGKLMAGKMKTSYLLVKVKRFSFKIRNKTKGYLFYLLLFCIVLGILARQNRQNKAIEII